MSYQVLARKYRPQKFGEVVGQEHVTRTLQNALEQKRIHHAYLFCGSRGVGKTTVARILAKALNCETGLKGQGQALPGREANPKDLRSSIDPCNRCVVCQEVTSGHSLDVQEIDGASNTSVDDVREIREQVKYLPTHGKYRVYIIDEVHMLSTSAFNALLKTLEEPPPHVVFIFATTDWQKIPATILSRCQRYDFRRLATAEIVTSLQEIAQREKWEIGPETLKVLAREAEGSLRDAQSLLDQAVAYAGLAVAPADLQKMFGFLDREQMFSLLESITQKETKKALTLLNQLFQTGVDMQRLSLDLMQGLRSLLLLRAAEVSAEELEISDSEWKRYKELAQNKTVVEWDQLFQLTYAGVEDVLRSQSPKMVLEVLLVRLTQVDSLELVENVIEQNPVSKTASPANPRCQAPLGPPLQREPGTWDLFLQWVGQKKPQLASIFQHGRLQIFENAQIVLAYGPKEKVYAEMLEEPERKTQVDQMFEEFFHKKLELKLVETATTAVQAALPDKRQERKQQVETALNHENIRAAADILGARVEEVRSLKKEEIEI